MLVETAIVAPVLVLMSMGAFQVSQVVARQTELQGAAAEA
ncbi:MAG: pilus assembly protein, partial [Novosphingobium sp.]|nr:pilus assembly protein [Novosphingobium sp.]